MSHSKISELLPWYVNGSLDIGDRQAAALEVASCDECGKDVEELTKLQASMLELEALAPEPSEYGLTRALAAVEAEEEKKRLGHPWFGWWWALTPFRRAFTVSTVIGALVVLGIFVAPKHEVVPQSFGMTESATPVSLDEVALSGAASRSKAVGSAPVPMPANERAALTSSVPSLRADTQIARTGSVSLLVPDVEAAIAKITAAAQMQGGEVLSLNDQTPSQPGERHTAQVQIGVPVSRFDATIAALGRFGGLQSRSVSAENVATQIVDAQARLRNLRSTESDLLNIMSRAGKIDEVLAVENQVSATREQIEQLDGEVQALKHRVAMSTVTIDLEDEVAATAVEVGVGPQLRDSWNSALRSVRNFTVALVGGILWGVAYGPYVLALALAGGLVAMRWRR
jgi:hypothetical protein